MEQKGDSQKEITKDKNEKDLTYAVKANGESEDGEEVSIDFKMQYKNIAELNNVEENYEMSLKTKSNEDETKISLNYTNINTFATDVEIEGINNDNATIINDASDDELSDLLMTVYDKMGILNDEEDEDYTTDDQWYTTDEEKYNMEYKNSRPINIDQF